MSSRSTAPTSSPLKFLIVLFLFAGSLNGQTLISPANDSTRKDPDKVLLVILQGNEKTKEEIILREMRLKPGSKFSWQKLQQDQLRIQNLGIFNRVEIDMVPSENGAILIVSVSEMWYIFPYPIFFRNERDWSRLSYGAGLLYTNFRGRREVIDFSFWLGFNPSVKIAYSNPWILGNWKLYTSFLIFARKIRNLSFTVLDSVVTENQIGFDWRIGKRFGHFTFMDLTLGYRQLSLSQNQPGLTLSSSGKDRLPRVGISFKYDSRDLWEYAHKGNYVHLWAMKTGFSKDIDYLRYGADLRKYIPVGPTTFAFRAATNLSSGRIPVYDQVHFGFLTRIRGHFRERNSGENRLIGSAEFRFPIFKIRYYDLGAFQAMGRYGANFRFGVNAGLFIDTGAVWFRSDGLSDNDFISGWGAGLHFFLPYNNLMRLEYGFNENWDGQVIVDALITF